MRSSCCAHFCRVLHVVITLAAGYAVGSEFRRRSLRTCLPARRQPDRGACRQAGAAVPDFHCPHAVDASPPGGAARISFKGDVPMIVVSAALMIAGYLALGALLQLLVRDLAPALA